MIPTFSCWFSFEIIFLKSPLTLLKYTSHVMWDSFFFLDFFLGFLYLYLSLSLSASIWFHQQLKEHERSTFVTPYYHVVHDTSNLYMCCCLFCYYLLNFDLPSLPSLFLIAYRFIWLYRGTQREKWFRDFNFFKMIFFWKYDIKLSPHSFSFFNPMSQ